MGFFFIKVIHHIIYLYRKEKSTVIAHIIIENKITELNISLLLFALIFNRIYYYLIKPLTTFKDHKKKMIQIFLCDFMKFRY